MPHVLHLYNVFGAGTERAWLDYPLALAQRGWVASFACERRADEAPSVVQQITPLRRITVGPTDDVPAQMDHIAERVDDPAKQGLLERPIDLVHGHFGPRVLHAAAWLRRGVPAVISLYGYDASRLLLDPAWGHRFRWAAERGAVFVVLCEAMRQRLLKSGLPEARVRIIRLGIDPEAWPYTPQPAPDPPRFLFVGRLTPKKAPGHALRALALLRNRHAIPASLDVIGTGPLEAELRAQARQLGLGSAVRFLGDRPREALAEPMRAVTGLVLPSVTAPDGDCEGTPLVLMEAQATGVPCVTTRHSGNPEVLPPEAQDWVVGEGDAAALAAAMARLARLPDRERRTLQDAGRRHIERHYSLKSTVAGYDRLYREMIRDRAKPPPADAETALSPVRATPFLTSASSPRR